MILIDHTKIDNIMFGGIDHNDYPDYCDAYILSADYDGTPMTDDQMDELNEDRYFVYEKLWNFLN